MAVKNLSVRIDSELLDKLHYVAAYEGRSANGQLNALARQCVDEHERRYGEIPVGKRIRKTNPKKKEAE